jgi:hypothetical protein
MRDLSFEGTKIEKITTLNYSVFPDALTYWGKGKGKGKRWSPYA